MTFGGDFKCAPRRSGAVRICSIRSMLHCVHLTGVKVRHRHWSVMGKCDVGVRRGDHIPKEWVVSGLRGVREEGALRHLKGRVRREGCLRGGPGGTGSLEGWRGCFRDGHMHQLGQPERRSIYCWLSNDRTWVGEVAWPMGRRDRRGALVSENEGCPARWEDWGNCRSQRGSRAAPRLRM